MRLLRKDCRSPSKGLPVTFKPQTYAEQDQQGTVHEIINGIETPITRNEAGEYPISDQATGFIYRVDSPDGENHFAYRFSKYRPTDSTLKTLSTNGYLVHLDQEGNVVEGFDPEVTEYYMLTNDLNDIKVETEANDTAAEVVSTLDGRSIAPVKKVMSRSFRQVQENNAQSDEIKEYEINVKAQSDAATVYTVLVSNKFDFLDLGEKIEDTEKEKLQTTINEAQELLNQGNYDTLLYEDLNKAVNNARSLINKNYIVEEDYQTASDHLVEQMNRYRTVLFDDYRTLYDKTMPSTESSILKHPTQLRNALIENNSEEFIINNGTLTFYAGTAKEVTIPDGVTRIGAYAFAGCDTLTKVTLNNVTEIGYAAFEGCTNLTDIVSLNNISLNHRSFWNTKITISDDKNWIYDTTGEKLIGSVSTPEVLSIPMGVTSIDAYAFHGVKNVTSIIIPYTVTSIGTKAFLDSTDLKDVNFAGNRLSLDHVFDERIVPVGMEEAPVYNVTLSQRSDNESEAPTFSLKGEGSYQVGDSVEITAPFNSDYTFAGWKHAEDETTYFSTASTLKLTITSDINLIAYYTPAETYTLTLKYDEDGGTASTSQSTEAIKYGTEMKLTATPKDGYKFDGWFTDGIFVSQDTAYTARILANKAIEAVFTKKEFFTVTFADSYGVVYKTETVESGKSATAPEDVSRTGYLFDGWDRDYSSIMENTVVHAKFKMAPAAYEIKIENGRYMDSKNPHIYSYGELVRVIANVAPRNTKFSHWENEKGTVVSYDETYSFAATESTTLKAVYAKETEKKPIALLNKITVNTATSKISFTNQVVVPEGYEAVEFGLLLYRGEEFKEELTFTTENVIRAKSPVANKYGQFALSAKVGSGKKATARTYLIYKNKSDNTLTTVYSDIQTTEMP